MKRRIISMLLIMSVLSVILFSCSGNKETNNEPSGNTGVTQSTEGGLKITMTKEGYPKLSEKTEFKIMTTSSIPDGPGAWNTPNDIPLFKEYEEKTNIHIQWETLTRQSWQERMNVLIGSDDLPDVFMKSYRLTDADLVKHGGSGTFINIEPYLNDYAPDFKKYVDEHDLTRYLKMGGGVWSFPYIFDSEGITINKVFFNIDWLKKVGKEMPVTIDEYTDVFRTFKKQDPNGNGNPNDEIPMAVFSIENFVSIFGGAYGLSNRGISNAYLDVDPSDPSGNKIRFWRSDEKMKDVLKLMKLYWDEELISHNIFDADYAVIFDDNHLHNLHGAHGVWPAVSGPDQIDKFVATNEPPKGSAGQLWSNVSGRIGSKSAFIITKECKHPEAMVGWANYFYTQQGAYDYFLGKEGVTYTIDDKGHTHITDWVNKNPDGLTYDQALLRYSIFALGNNPGLATDETFKGGETYWTSLEGSARYKSYIPETIWESIPLSIEGAEVISGIKGDIETVINEYESKFVTGALDIDKSWDEYMSKLDQAGKDKYTDIYQKALEELNAK